MPPLAAPPSKSGSWPINVGAEGIAAAQFARCGFDVLVQAGPDKPWYNLLVTKAGNILKIAVKASDDGRWNLVHSYLGRASNGHAKDRQENGAIDRWLDMHGSRTIYCLVQFEGVPLNQLPRIYLATPGDIARKMRESAERLGEAILFEQYQWTTVDTGYSSTEALPSTWLFSRERIEELFFPEPSSEILMPAGRPGPVAVEMRSKAADHPREGMREAFVTA